MLLFSVIATLACLAYSRGGGNPGYTTGGGMSWVVSSQSASSASTFQHNSTKNGSTAHCVCSGFDRHVSHFSYVHWLARQATAYVMCDVMPSYKLYLMVIQYLGSPIYISYRPLEMTVLGLLSQCSCMWMG